MTVEEMAAQLEVSNKTMAELSAQVADLPKFKESLSALTKENETLKSEVAKRTQESQILTLKTEFPDIPVDLLPQGSFEVMKAHAEKLKAWKGSNVAAPVVTQNPADAWFNAGRISPSTDAELAARRAEAEKTKEEAKKKGDVHGVIQSIMSVNAPKVAAIFGLGKR